jgi:translation initiation factor 5
MSDTINMNGSDDPFYRYVVKKIKIKHETGKTVIFNNDIISKQTGRPNDWIVTYIGQALGVSTNIDKKNQNKCILTGKHDECILQEKYFEFVKKYILCKSCGNPETIPKIIGKKKNSNIELLCRSCGKSSELDAEDKFVKFMVLHPVSEDSDKKIKTNEILDNKETIQQITLKDKSIVDNDNNDNTSINSIDSIDSITLDNI